jgi:hypothetical protein
MAKQPEVVPAEGISNWVQQCKFGGHAQHTAAPYGFVDGTGAFPHSGLLFNCVTGEGKGRRAAIDHRNWRPIHDGHPEFVVNLSSRACGACQRALREHALELGKATAAQRDVSGSSAGGISDPHEGGGAGGASTSQAIPHDVLMCNSPRDPDVSRAFSHASNNALLVGLAVQNAALSRKLKLKQPKRCVLSLFHDPLFCVSGEQVEGICGC